LAQAFLASPWAGGLGLLGAHPDCWRAQAAMAYGGRDGPVFGQRVRESGNSFASGSNQNSGNILCDVPSTRVARPPGGASSINFGWDDRPVQRDSDRPAQQRGSDRSLQQRASDRPVQQQRGSGGRRKSPGGSVGQDNFIAGVAPRTSSNSFATGSNQNCGNVVSDVPTTRVISPPGGSSSINFGWTDSGGPERFAGMAPNSRRTAPPVAGYAGPSGDFSPPSSPQARRSVGRAPMAGAGYKSGHRDGFSPPSSPVAGRAGRPQPLASGSHSGASGEGVSPPTSPVGSATSAPQSPHEASRHGYGGQRSYNQAYGNYGAPLPSSSQKAGADNMRQEAQRQGPSGHSPQSQYREEAFGARPRVTGNAYASGANQNCGNVLTGVPSTRVNRPPGGASAFSLSWDAEDKQAPPMNTSPRARRGSGGVPGSQQGGSQQNARGSQPGARRQQPEAAFGARPRESSNVFATGSNQNCGNMISDTPTTRVMRPPGGASSFSLAWD